MTRAKNCLQMSSPMHDNPVLILIPQVCTMLFVRWYISIYDSTDGTSDVIVIS